MMISDTIYNLTAHLMLVLGGAGQAGVVVAQHHVADDVQVDPLEGVRQRVGAEDGEH